MQFFSGNATTSPDKLPTPSNSTMSPFQHNHQTVINMGQFSNNYSNPSETATAGYYDANSFLINSISKTAMTASTTSIDNGPRDKSIQTLFANGNAQEKNGVNKIGGDRKNDFSTNMTRRNAVANIQDGVEANEWIRAMELASVNEERDAVLESILRRLDRIERRLKALEKGKKSATMDESSSKRIDNPMKFRDRFYDSVTIIGLREMVGSRHSGVQAFWLTFFIICLMSMGYFVFKTCTEYLGDPTATKVKLIEDDKYDYPTMLLCPDTWLDAEKAIEDGLTFEGLQYALGYLINYYVHPPPYRIADYAQSQTDFFTYYERRRFTDLVEFFKFVALDSEAFFYKCPFCRNQTFNKIIMSEGVCYEVSMLPSPGNAPVVSSLDMLDVVVPDRTLNLLTRRSYWRLFLGSDLRLGESTRRYAEILPRQTNTLQFITHRFVAVGKKENPCIKPSDTKNYSYARCVLKCFVEKYGGLQFLMTACSASEPSASCDNTMLTPNQTFQFYAEDLWQRLSFIHQSEKGGEEAPDHCYERCPSLCERKIYTIDVQSHPMTRIIDLSLRPTMTSSTEDPPDPTSKDENHKRKIRAKNQNSFSTPENLTRIYFLNSAAVYGGVLTFQEVSTYSFETMVGNVGGMLSLWMGVSIMSLIQVAMFFMTEWISCKGKRRTNSTKHQNGVIVDSPIPGGTVLLQSSLV